MKQKFKQLGLLMALLLASLQAAAYDFEVDGIYYTVISPSDLTCEVSPSPNEEGATEISHYEGDIVIPSTVEFRDRTLSVTGIGRKAFYECENLTSVILPETVTTIGDNAFQGCTSLASVSLPDSLKEIGGDAFRGCKSLSSIKLPESLTKIGEGAFGACELMTISLPPLLTTIEKEAFIGCAFTTITIPDNVTKIREGAFKNCKSLKSIILSNSLRTIYSETFLGCSALESISIPESVTIIQAFAFEDCSSLTSVSLPESMTIIDQEVFMNCISLTSINLPNSIEKIGFNAFKNCISLEHLKLPSSLSAIPSGLCMNCKSLKSINLTAPKIVYGDCDNDYGYPFGGCDQLVRLSIERDYKNINPGYFNLSDMGIDPIQIKILYTEYNFPHIALFENLIKLELGEHVTLLESTGKDVYMPSSLEQIICYGDEPPSYLKPGAYYEISDKYLFTNSQYFDLKVFVPNESLETYKNAEPWKNFWEIQGFDPAGIEDVEQTTELTEIGRYDLYGRSVSEDYVGIVIISYSDGSSKKVLNRTR